MARSTWMILTACFVNGIGSDSETFTLLGYQRYAPKAMASQARLYLNAIPMHQMAPSIAVLVNNPKKSPPKAAEVIWR